MTNPTKWLGAQGNQISMGIRPSLISRRSAFNGCLWPQISTCEQWKLIKLCRWQGWFESALDSHVILFITKTRLFKYIENFTSKNWKFAEKNSDFFYISAQNIDCGYSLEPPRRGGSKEYPQSMFLSRNKKNNVYPFKPQFYYIKVRFKGVKII